MTQTLRNYLEQRLGIKATNAEETRFSEIASQACEIRNEAGDHAGAKNYGWTTLTLGIQEQARKTLEVFEMVIDDKNSFVGLVDDYMREQGYDTYVEGITRDSLLPFSWDEYFDLKREKNNILKRVEYIRNTGQIPHKLKIQLYEEEYEREEE